MTPERVDEIFRALKLHFSTSYDFHKYGGKLKRQKNNLSRNFKISYLLSELNDEESEIILYFVINQTFHYINDTKYCSFINELITKELIVFYKTQKSIIQNLKNTMHIEISNIINMHGKQGLLDFDLLTEKLYGKKLSIYTLLYLKKFLKYQKESITNPLSSDLWNILEKIESFFPINKKYFIDNLKKAVEQV